MNLPALTKAEIRLKNFLRCLLLLSLAMIVTLLFGLWKDSLWYQWTDRGYVLFFNRSLPQACILIILLGLSLSDIRRFSVLIQFLKACFFIAAAVSFYEWAFQEHFLLKGAEWLLPFGAHLVLFLLLAYLHNRAQKARYNLRYFSVQQFQTLEALATVCIAGFSGQKIQITPQEVARNVDGYLVSFQAKSKWVMRLVLTCLEYYPLLSLRAPLRLMQPEKRLAFLKKRFMVDYSYRVLPAWYKSLVQAAIRMAKQLCYTGYYSDARVYESIGYVPYSKRKDKQEREDRFPEGPLMAEYLDVMTDADIKGNEYVADDVVIVGSGAAASILAHQLVKQGRKVLLVEKGSYEKPKSFTENEVEMVSRLYSDGALQLSRDFRFQVFQGSCVGGSTVVNNAVCFDTPEYILDKWINEMGIGIDKATYMASMKAVNELIGVKHTPTMTIDQYLNPGGVLFAEACRNNGYNIPQMDSVMANINGCVGCGYCNIGCKSGRKLSMLDNILPKIQKEYPGSLKIIADCEALKFNRDGNKIVSLSVRSKRGRKITIKGKTFVSSAGAISSSILLLNSKLGIKNAGKKLAFNLGTQITAAYKTPIHSYDGLQISHYLRTGDNRFVMETWFNPPMFQSTAMPGWFEQHFDNMKHYAHMACTGVLVGTASNAEVRAAGLFRRDIKYVPTEEDFDSLMDGLEKVSEIYLSDKNFEKIMPNSFIYYEYRNADELKRNLRKNIKSSIDISTGSGHPQGGNVMAANAAEGVVDDHFKVFGYDNLYVCDASVFPTSLGVNPQVTVMSLAHYAAPLIA